MRLVKIATQPSVELFEGHAYAVALVLPHNVLVLARIRHLAMDSELRLDHRCELRKHGWAPASQRARGRNARTEASSVRWTARTSPALSIHPGRRKTPPVVPEQLPLLPLRTSHPCIYPQLAYGGDRVGKTVCPGTPRPIAERFVTADCSPPGTSCRCGLSSLFGTYPRVAAC